MSGVIWDGERDALVKELGDARYCYRTLTGLAESTGLKEEKVLIILNDLIKGGSVKKSPSNINHWGLITRIKEWEASHCWGCEG